LDELICVLDLARAGVALVYQIEQLSNLAYDFVMVQILRLHPRLVSRALVLIPGVHPPLAWLHPTADEVPSHSRSIKPIPREQRHQLLHLPSQLWSLVPGYSLVWNVPNIAKRGTVGLFADVKPFLVPISERCVPGTVEISCFIPSRRVRYTPLVIFDPPWDPFFLKQNIYLKRSKWGWIPPYASQRWIKTETRKIELGCRLQIPIS
jgi:hypothetical protein